MEDELTLSVVDVGWPGDVPMLADSLEQAGYHRYWLTEHRSPQQSAAPTLLAALAASQTETIRIGTAGILLRYASPLRVAEEFRLLSLFFGERLDLGVVGARLSRETAQAMGVSPDADDYHHRVERLAELVASTTASDKSLIGPASRDESRPQLWVCGTSEKSALLAARVGANYAFHHYLASQRDSGRDGRAIVDVYRDNFRVSNFGSKPHVSVAGYGLCTLVTSANAMEEWERVLGESSTTSNQPSFLGTPETCVRQLTQLRSKYQANELAIQLLGGELATRIECYKAIAHLAGLRQP